MQLCLYNDVAAALPDDSVHGGTPEPSPLIASSVVSTLPQLKHGGLAKNTAIAQRASRSNEVVTGI
jgi:hypothetical protein